MTPLFFHWHNQPTEYQNLCTYASLKIWGKVKAFSQGTAMGVFDSGQLKAAMIFHNYDSEAGVIEVSGAGETPRWLTRHVLSVMFNYPFKELSCQAVVMRCDGKDTRLGSILPRYGFTRHDIPHLRGKNKAEALYVLTDDAWLSNGFNN